MTLFHVKQSYFENGNGFLSCTQTFKYDKGFGFSRKAIISKPIIFLLEFTYDNLKASYQVLVKFKTWVL